MMPMRKIFHRNKIETESHAQVLYEEEGVQILQIEVVGNSYVAGKQIWSIRLPKEVIIGWILRNGEAIVPCGDTVLQPGDVLMVISRNQQQKEAVRVLEAR